MHPFFTIGHSTRTIDAFVALLRANEVTRLVDVRSFPRSRTNPQYNVDALPGHLAPHGIEHEHLPALGGKRKRDPSIAPEVNGFWDNDGFHAYADYAMSSPEYERGLDHLVALGRRERCAIMCAESVWWRCHRRIVTDYLLAAGHDVFHILESPVPEPARITPEAQPTQDGRLRYPGAQGGLGL
jgi:uncharacterized protein (DUF488 family)